MNEPLTPKSEKIIDLARSESRRKQLEQIDLSSLLVAMSQVDSLASKALKAFGLSAKNIMDIPNSRNQAMESPLESSSEKIELSSDTRRIMLSSRKISFKFHHIYIGTEHLLLAILLDDVGASLIKERGVDPEKVCNFVLRLIGKSDIDYAALQTFMTG